MSLVHERGFSLVEAIVALVVLSLVFTATWGWFGTATTSTKRIEQALALPDVFSQFIVRIELEDLQSLQSGSYQIGQYEVVWQASVDRQSDKELYRRQPAWIVALFNINVSIFADGNIVSEFQTKALKQWRDPTYIAPPEF